MNSHRLAILDVAKKAELENKKTTVVTKTPGSDDKTESSGPSDAASEVVSTEPTSEATEPETPAPAEPPEDPEAPGEDTRMKLLRKVSSNKFFCCFFKCCCVLLETVKPG